MATIDELTIDVAALKTDVAALMRRIIELQTIHDDLRANVAALRREVSDFQPKAVAKVRRTTEELLSITHGIKARNKQK